MADQLAVFDAEDYSDACYIAWVFDGDAGGALGDPTYTQADLVKAAADPTGDDWDHVKATITASKTVGVERIRARYAHTTCYVWPNRKLANAALRAIRAALKDKGDKPWPEWAVKAKAAGWTAPKGWTP